MLIDLPKIKYKPAIPFNGLMLLGSNVLGVSKYIVIVCIEFIIYLKVNIKQNCVGNRISKSFVCWEKNKTRSAVLSCRQKGD